MENQTDYEYPTHVNASFANRKSAELAFDELIYRGYKAEEINVLMAEDAHSVHVTPENKNSGSNEKIVEKAGLGSAVGGAVGAIASAVATIGTAVLIPPLGIAVSGPLLAAFAGAGAGGLTGGLVGALVGSGMSKEHADAYETTIQEGGIIISFVPKTVEDRIEIITEWNKLGARQLHGNENYTA